MRYTGHNSTDRRQQKEAMAYKTIHKNLELEQHEQHKNVSHCCR